MNYANLTLRVLPIALGLSFASGCIINTSDDEDDGAVDTGGTPPNTDDPGTTDDGPDDTGPITTGMDCSANVVLDPGFEAGTPSSAWGESSLVFGTPICDASCTDEAGADPYQGDWWVWLGGVEDEPEEAAVSQMVTISPETAYLTFYFQVRSAAGTGDDLFTVTLGGDTVFMASDFDMADYGAYTLIELDVSDWADGGTYELRFAGAVTGNGLTSFFVDEVSLVTCSGVVDTGGTDTGETDGVDTTADGGSTDTGTTGDTDGTTGGSGTDGGSSSSSGGAG